MWKQHEFETILTSSDVINIQYGTEKVFGSREISYSMGMNDYFGPRRKYISNAPPNNGPGKSRFEVDYFRQIYCSL